MNYKYRQKQIFGKRLKVPKFILSKVYNDDLSLDEYVKYDLIDKIPMTCLKTTDRQILEKFGIEKVKDLDWKLMNKNLMVNIDFREVLMNTDESVEDLNMHLYELVKDQIVPREYSTKMKEVYHDRLFTEEDINRDIDLYSQKVAFNDGRVSLVNLINNWSLFGDKDLSYCLKRDANNTFDINDEQLKKFMSDFGVISDLILNNTDIYQFIHEVNSVKSEEERREYIKKITDTILEKKISDNSPKNVELTNEQYAKLFQYSSMYDYLKKTTGMLDRDLNSFFEELETLPKDYIYDIPVPFAILKNNDVFYFICSYGIKNIIDFDDECEQFFTKNNCQMLKKMNGYHLIYSVDSKDDFYALMREIATRRSWHNSENFDYRNMTGEFKRRNPDLFIDEKAPKELREAFYNRTIDMNFILSHPNYHDYLRSVNLNLICEYIPIMYDNQSLVDIIAKTFGKDSFDVMLLYGEYIERANAINHFNKFKLKDSFSKEDLLDEIDANIFQAITSGKMKYDEQMPIHFKKRYPDLFIDEKAPEELREVFYNREVNVKFMALHPHYQSYLRDVDLRLLCKYMPIGNGESSIVDIIAKTFGKDSFDVMLLYGEYIERAYAINYFNDFKLKDSFSKKELLDEIDANIFQAITSGKMKYDEQMPIHFKKNNRTLFLDRRVSENIRQKFYNKDLTINDFYSDPTLLETFGDTNIVYGFSEEYAWISSLFADGVDLKKDNVNRLKIISEYSKIADGSLRNLFKDYVTSHAESIDMSKIEYVSEVLSRLSLSNSSEIFTFRKELAAQILETSSPIETLDKIEDMFIRNNIPTIGKIYSCFEILHPDFKGFNFNDSMISPILKNSSMMSKKATIFSDLLKASFGSNNRSIIAYLKNVEKGYGLYERIKSGREDYETLNDLDKNELKIFRDHLVTLHDNTMRGKKRNEVFDKTDDVMNDISHLAKWFSPDGTLNYNLADRVIRMFCGISGIDTLDQAKSYVEQKVKRADIKNRKTANSEVSLERGDFVKGIGDITYLGNILQNGSVAREYLCASAGSDLTPLDTDVSMITSDAGTISEKIGATAALNYGPIWFVLKNDDRFVITRDESETLPLNRDAKKLEVFYTGALGEGHYGIRTGFASSEIDYIFMRDYDPRVGLEIAINGFYIPVVDREGKVVFTPSDYDELREKMNGLSHYGMGEYHFDSSIDNLNSELTDILKNMDENSSITEKKAQLIRQSMASKLGEMGLSLTDQIDLQNNSVTLFNTGSTGRFTNLPGDGDFDFIMQVDRSYFENFEKMEQIRKAIVNSFSLQEDYLNIGGDIREFKTEVIAERGEKYPVEIDVTFVTKTDKTEYASDVCVLDRLQNMPNDEKANLVKANIILAKKLLQGLHAYKPARKDSNQGGLGGIGVENWILQNGGTLYSAAKSFMKCANECEDFEEFKNRYKLYNFGINHMAEKRGKYPHDDYVENMNTRGYEKMKAGLGLFLELFEANVDEPCRTAIEKFRDRDLNLENFIDKTRYDNVEDIMSDTQQIINANLGDDITINRVDMGQTGFMYQFSHEGNTYLAKAGVNKGNMFVNPARAEAQEAASNLQKLLSPGTMVPVKTFGNGKFRVAVQQKIADAKRISTDELIEKHTDELLGEYVCDYLLGNFDADESNFIIDCNNKLYGIDKEQSFKYLLTDDQDRTLSLDFSFSPNGSRNSIYPKLINHLKEVGLSSKNLQFLNNTLFTLRSISDDEYKNIFKKYAYSYDSNRSGEILDKILLRKKYFETELEEFIEPLNICDDKVTSL